MRSLAALELQGRVRKIGHEAGATGKAMASE